MTGKHDTVGIDIVSHCVNDILVQGAKPLFFMDYIATSKLRPEVITEIIRGFAKACKENNCALIGGEIAELPGLYKKNEYDLAGFIVGVVEKSRIINGKKIKEGDKVIGLASSGLHTNGFSLALRALGGRSMPESIKRQLMKPHKSYLKAVSSVMKDFKIKGMAHITGGGFYDNIVRILPAKLGAVIRKDSWKVPRIFRMIQQRGNVSEHEMYRVFNMGIGLVMVVDDKLCDDAVAVLKKSREKAFIIGEVTKAEGVVVK